MSKDNYKSFFPGISHKALSKKDLTKRIQEAKNGDQDAYRDILCHMYNYIAYLSKEFFIQGSEVEDLWQECAIKLMNIIEKFEKSKGSFNSFAQSSMRKHIITIINKEKAKKRYVLNNSYSLDASKENDDGDQLSYIDTIANENSLSKQPHGDPLDLVNRDYEEYMIDEVCRSLSDMEKKVFILRFIEGYSYKEVAQKLSLYRINKRGERVLDQKSVDNAIWRSRPKIKRSLERLRIRSKYFR